MNRKKGFQGAGLSTVLLIFVVLCLVIFAVLSLSTARADLQMSQKIAERTTAYYKAQSLAYKQVRAIDEELSEQYNGSQKEEIRSFTQPIDENQQIKVELQIRKPEKEGDSFCRIIGWETQQTTEWKADTGLPVLRKEKNDD